MREPCVYIMASISRALYVGVTSNLTARVHQHRAGAFDGFTAKYAIKRLVWYEPGETMDGAIAREKQLKRWHREWKINLIEVSNPEWRDLAVDLGFEPQGHEEK